MKLQDFPAGFIDIGTPPAQIKRSLLGQLANKEAHKQACGDSHSNEVEEAAAVYGELFAGHGAVGKNGSGDGPSKSPSG